MVPGGVRKQIDGRDMVTGPDDLTHLQVPPHIRIVETCSFGKHRKWQEQTHQYHRKGEDKPQHVRGIQSRLRLKSGGRSAHTAPSPWASS